LKIRVKVLQKKSTKIEQQNIKHARFTGRNKKKKLIEDDAHKLLENEFEGTQLKLFKNELSNKKRKPSGCKSTAEN